MITKTKVQFSIIIVSLNSGDSLLFTINSVLEQNYSNFEIIVKDGMSSDSSLINIPNNDRRIKIFKKPDKGIYDAMNQAIQYAKGRFVIFMNCGDSFYDSKVLNNLCNFLEEENAIYYGNCYTRNRGYVLKYPDVFNDYVCFTKTLCHQSTIYPLKLLKQRSFNTDYRIDADFEYYVNAYCNGTKIKHIDMIISNYEGGGVSETPKNRKESIKKAKLILKKNLGNKRYYLAKFKADLRLFSFKQWLSSLSWFYPLYIKIAAKHYGRKQNDSSKTNK